MTHTSLVEEPSPLGMAMGIRVREDCRIFGLSIVSSALNIAQEMSVAEFRDVSPRVERVLTRATAQPSLASALVVLGEWEP